MFDSDDLAQLAQALGELQVASSDKERVARIRALEQLKSAVAAAQAAETAAYATSQRAELRSAGVPADRIEHSIAGEVALARHISPFHARRYANWVTVLIRELPATFTALREGRTSESRAMIGSRETIWLPTREQRAAVDAEVAAHIEGWGDRRVEAETRKLTYRLDPTGYLKRCRGAEANRRVSLRPAPDTMARLTGFIPVAQGVAALAALTKHADALIAAGDERGRGQIMADTYIERLTGQKRAEDVPVEVNVVITDTALLGGTIPRDVSAPASDTVVDVGPDEPAHVVGYGPVPAGYARALIFGPGAETPRWIRRLYRHPRSRHLVTMDSRRRCFTPAQRHFFTLRDQVCRTPWCDAPIRHIDHVTPHDHGGRTRLDNGQGYCAACNFAKQVAGWRTTAIAGTDDIDITTPTGYTYRHAPPEPVGSRAISTSRERQPRLSS